MKKKILIGIAGLVLSSQHLMALEYSYLPPEPINYVKSYIFAFDIQVNDNISGKNEKSDRIFGLSMRKINYFQSDSELEYQSNWNYGYKGALNYHYNFQKEYLRFSIGPTLGYNITNHLNIYVSSGINTYYMLKNNTTSSNSNNSSSKLTPGIYGEIGTEYFINDDISLFLNTQKNIVTKAIEGNSKNFQTLNLGLKITFR